LGDDFTINIDLVSNVNLEREVRVESQKTRVYKPTLKLGVCKEFSWKQTLGLGLIHLGETLLGISLLVTGRDSEL